MHELQRRQARETLRARVLPRALFAHRHSVTWLTGFAPPIELGDNPFAGALPLVWYEDGRYTLVIVDAHADAAAPLEGESDCAVLTYPGYTIRHPIDGFARLQEALLSLWRGPRAGPIGIESADVTAAVEALMMETLPGAGLVPIDGCLKPMRQIKSAEEVAKLRENFWLTDVGHAGARGAVRAGAREIDVWNAAHAAVQAAAGCRVPMGNDCVAGYRKANVGGWPLDFALRPGDSIIVDLSTIRHGYWSDSCATYYAGEPDALQRELRAVCTDALAYGASLLKPGAAAREIDAELRAFVARAGHGAYPHHTGHGVGLSGHESPRIVPTSDETLSAGMVVMLEPGIYLPGQTAVRLEDGFLITADGAERMTRHLL